MISRVSHAASSEASNKATRAMSSGWPTRPSGVLAIICFLASAPITPAACAPSVSVPPGLRALTRIFLGPNSFDSTRVKPYSALGRHIDRKGRVGSDTGRRCDVDIAPAFRPEGRQSGFNHEERAEHVRVELAVK